MPIKKQLKVPETIDEVCEGSDGEYNEDNEVDNEIELNEDFLDALNNENYVSQSEILKNQKEIEKQEKQQDKDEKRRNKIEKQQEKDEKKSRKITC